MGIGQQKSDYRKKNIYRTNVVMSSRNAIWCMNAFTIKRTFIFNILGPIAKMLEANVKVERITKLSNYSLT